jgi:hypothetical protein
LPSSGLMSLGWEGGVGSYTGLKSRWRVECEAMIGQTAPLFHPITASPPTQCLLQGPHKKHRYYPWWQQLQYLLKWETFEHSAWHTAESRSNTLTNQLLKRLNAWRRILLQKLMVTQLVKYYHALFMEIKGSLLYSQESTTDPSVNHMILIQEHTRQISHLPCVSQWCLSPQ